jgi:hypothetical protein
MQQQVSTHERRQEDQVDGGLLPLQVEGHEEPHAQDECLGSIFKISFGRNLRTET